ncbi:MAG TPA: oligopeptide transporter, OPT family [candidate division Zixibacteria bacterium]|nr:oligopeptide transporter, OPT family [candidate division Zixibacteria bacterium]MDD4916650.1 oligopeptide transporter, OPT family [candidate division Zixibacteria bacterium]MDM7973208.1 oligopeptide transporter, OPT family [candidate division Zixibacteria bacterium]HOD67059.1 oligopeptide transporter, OPT family [candidate division Zixibacteria bacterium]HPM37890.1 oligopeptide transporter, OPT family [candidate division Zixibacteria bacterium]
MKDPHFSPFVPPDRSLREFTFRAVALGAILGIVFAASSVYLALKVGMTVSASIPIAVLSITLFRVLGRATILENNIVQTTGSAGESIAFGVATTMPVFLLLGQDMELLSICWMALLGGILGVLMMIPLRQGLIVKEHGRLTYPEGTACADVLIVGEQGGTNAKTVFLGFGLGAAYKFLNAGMKLWAEIPNRMLGFFKGASVAAEITPELLGVGYIIGRRVSANMMAGGLLSYLILIPAITIFGENLTAPMFPATTLIRDMSPNEVRNAYVLYIGAGAVATGGIISLIRSFPTIIAAFRRGFRTFLDSRAGKGAQEAVLRTERDLPLSVVVFGSIGLVLAIWLSPILHINVISAVLIVLFGFFFVTVSSRITGEIGSSSNPISGMTVATLLITCLLFLAVGWTGVSYRAMALSTAAIVCIAASNGGTISQDLKTGFLVGATPRLQQIAIMIGVISSALVIGLIVIALNNAYTTVTPARHPDYLAAAAPGAETQQGPDGAMYRVHYVNEPVGTVLIGKYLVDDSGRIAYLVDPGIAGVVSEVDGKQVTKLDSPKARLFSLIIDGILTQKLPWGLVLIGVFLALMMELVGISSLPFAVGLYLPLSSSAPIMAGGLIRGIVDRKRKSNSAEAEFSPGVLMSSGFIAGAAIMGIVVAGLTGFGLDKAINGSGWSHYLSEADWFSLIPFGALMYMLYRVGVSVKDKGKQKSAA